MLINKKIIFTDGFRFGSVLVRNGNEWVFVVVVNDNDDDAMSTMANDYDILY